MELTQDQLRIKEMVDKINERGRENAREADRNLKYRRILEEQGIQIF